MPSPYLSIPTASNFLCFYFKEFLNKFLFENNKKAAIESKIYRNQTYVTDYGNLDFEERVKLISNDTYYIDKEFINGKFCLFLDDIKITGSHEHTVNKILSQYDVKGDFFFIYFAELVNKDIHPNIENYFNYFSVKGIEEIIDVVSRKNFQFNTRIVKYILNLNEDELTLLLNSINSIRREELFLLSISNNYHQIREYNKNLTTIKTI
uniref:phosphoribosyltransferase family protein n=1 Tax=Flavobacterium sp. TaxID=239 RepID=UPI00404A9B9D